jgi:hypothetical protein
LALEIASISVPPSTTIVGIPITDETQPFIDLPLRRYLGLDWREYVAIE